LFLGDDFNYVKLPGGNGDLYETWGVDISTFNRDVNDGSPQVWRFGTDGILKMPSGNETTAGWIQWSHASDDLTNVAGAGFVDYFNAYTGLGLTAPTDTNAEKGIWFGTPSDPTSPFQPETSMVFRNDTLYLPKNGFIKSHDINRVGYANLTTVGTTITIQTNDEYDWVFGTDGILTLPTGSTLGETSSTTVITPPGALMGQSLVIRPTAVGILTSDHPSGFVDGDSITLTIQPNNGAPVTGTVGYTFTGATTEQLGRALTGTLTFTNQVNQTLTWTIPANSNIDSFTFTLGTPSGFSWGGTGNPYITLTRNGSSEDYHIHLVTGNPAMVDLYLGDDDQYVKIEKNAGNVVVGTNTNTNHWTFGTDGNLTLPASGLIKNSDGTNYGGSIGDFVVTNTTLSAAAGSVAVSSYGVSNIAWVSGDSTYVVTYPSAIGYGYHTKVKFASTGVSQLDNHTFYLNPYNNSTTQYAIYSDYDCTIKIDGSGYDAWTSNAGVTTELITGSKITIKTGTPANGSDTDPGAIEFKIGGKTYGWIIDKDNHLQLPKDGGASKIKNYYGKNAVFQGDSITFADTTTQSTAYLGPVYCLAQLATNQSIPQGSDTKITLTAVTDTHGFINGSNEFAPNIAGTYMITASVLLGTNDTSSDTGQVNMQIHFNGTDQVYIAQHQINVTQPMTLCGSVILTFNGTTDKATITVYTSGTNGQTVNGGAGTIFTAHKL
jgi:hypothetical protein